MRYRAHVAFSTAYDMLKKLEQVHNRRKAFIYVSNGYDFNPFAEVAREGDATSATQRLNQNGDDGVGRTATINPFSMQTATGSPRRIWRRSWPS